MRRGSDGNKERKEEEMEEEGKLGIQKRGK